MAAFAASYPFVFKSSEGNGSDQVRGVCLHQLHQFVSWWYTALVRKPLALHMTDGQRLCMRDSGLSTARC